MILYPGGIRGVRDGSTRPKGMPPTNEDETTLEIVILCVSLGVLTVGAIISYYCVSNKNKELENVTMRAKTLEEAMQVLLDGTAETGKPVPAFLCPITFCVMEDPFTAQDGHTYERKAIQRWLSQVDGNMKISPLQGTPMGDNITTNWVVKDLIDEYRETGKVDPYTKKMIELHKKQSEFNRATQVLMEKQQGGKTTRADWVAHAESNEELEVLTKNVAKIKEEIKRFHRRRPTPRNSITSDRPGERLLIDRPEEEEPELPQSPGIYSPAAAWSLTEDREFKSREDETNESMIPPQIPISRELSIRSSGWANKSMATRQEEKQESVVTVRTTEWYPEKDRSVISNFDSNGLNGSQHERHGSQVVPIDDLSEPPTPTDEFVSKPML